MPRVSNISGLISTTCDWIPVSSCFPSISVLTVYACMGGSQVVDTLACSTPGADAIACRIDSYLLARSVQPG